MPLSDDQLKEIERMAELQFSVEEVAIISGAREEDIANDDDATKAYFRGRLRAQAEVRASILKLAKEGSAQPQKHFQELAAQSKPEIAEEDDE